MSYNVRLMYFVMCFALFFSGIVLGVENPTSSDSNTSLRIRSAHYAPKGLERFGSTGLGGFRGYSFGSKIQGDRVGMTVQDGQEKGLLVTNSVNRLGIAYSVSLFHELKSRKLYRIEFIQKIVPQMTDGECQKHVRLIADEVKDSLGVRMELVQNRLMNLKSLIKNKQPFVLCMAKDDCFKICISLVRHSHTFDEFIVSVENLNVRENLKYALPKDIQVINVQD